MIEEESTQIRKASTKDLTIIQAIEEESFKDPYPPFLISLLLRLYPKTFLVAEKTGLIVGYIVASNNRNAANIISVAVTRQERGRKIGKKLMEEATRILKKDGVETIRLEVRKSNSEAQRFYEALGYQYSHEVDNYYGDEDAKIYYKNL